MAVFVAADLDRVTWVGAGVIRDDYLTGFCRHSTQTISEYELLVQLREIRRMFSDRAGKPQPFVLKQEDP